MTATKVLGSLFSLIVVGGFVYFVVSRPGGVRLVREPKVGDVVNIQIGSIIIEGIRITQIAGNDITGVNKDGVQTFDRRDIMQNSLTIGSVDVLDAFAGQR